VSVYVCVSVRVCECERDRVCLCVSVCPEIIFFRKLLYEYPLLYATQILYFQFPTSTTKITEHGGLESLGTTVRKWYLLA